MAQTAERIEVTDDDLVHVGPGTPAGEWLRRFWHPIACSDDLPPEQPRPIRILGEDLTLYRGASGRAHLVGFRCAHRGNQLSLGWVEGDAIRCYYHGWRYDETGQCDRQPHEEHSFCDRIKIQSYPVQEYVGLIFAYLGPAPVPELPRYPMMEREGYAPDARMIPIDINYFQAIENNIDSGHVDFVHRRATFRPYTANADEILPIRLRVTETEYGIENCRSRGDGRWSYAHFLIPNIHCDIQAPNPGSAEPRHHYSWRTPVDDLHSLWFNLNAEPEAEWRARPRVVKSDYNEYADRVVKGLDSIHEVETNPFLTNVQDVVVLAGQGAIADRRGEHLGRSDAGVLLLRQIYKREIQALADGRPIKRWIRTNDPVSTKPD
jgi:5,5'-dehydrodivanillate O-demethylase